MRPQTTKRVARSILKSLNFVEFLKKKHHLGRSGTMAWPPLIFNKKVNNKLIYQYLLQVHHTIINGDNLSRSTVSGIAWTAICDSLSIFVGPYLTSKLS